VSNRLKLASAFAFLGFFGMTSVALAQTQTDACGPRKLTKKLEKPMDAVQKARDKKDWAGMLAAAKEVDAVPVEKTEYDKFWVHELQGVGYANLKQYPEAIKELEAAVASPCMSDTDRPNRMKLLMQLSYQSKDYPKTIEYGKKIFATGDTEAGIYLGNAYYITNDFENTRATMREVINKLESSGKTPDEPTYRILQSACLQLKDNDCVVEQIEKLVTTIRSPSTGPTWSTRCCAPVKTIASC